MRNKILLLSLFAMLAVNASAQQLKTMTSYYDIMRTRPSEVYTIIQATGAKHGNYKSYTLDGYVITACNYSNNELHGSYKEYYGQEKSTQLGISGGFNKGKKHGEWRYWEKTTPGKFFLSEITKYDNNVILEETYFYPKGNKREHYSRNGICSRWLEDGRKIEEWTGQNGRKNGIATTWITDHEGGYHLYKKITYVDNVKHGSAIQYRPNGQISVEETYVNDQLGECKTYYDNGNLRYIGSYQAHDFYFHDGTTLKQESRYVNGMDETILYDSLTHKKTVLFRARKPIGSNNLAGPNNFETKITYYSNGNPKIELNSTQTGDLLEKLYYDDGTLSSTTLSDNTILEYDSNSKLKRRIFKRANSTNKVRSFEAYDADGNKTEEGLMDDKRNVLEYTQYVNGVKDFHYNEKTRVITEYAPEGYISMITDADQLTTHYDAAGKVVGKSRPSTAPYETVFPPNDYVGFYSNGQVMEKGRKFRDGKISKWYLYSVSGKLSIWENGTTRKPTKEEKANHSQYLQDLINAKAPLKSTSTQSAVSKT